MSKIAFATYSELPNLTENDKLLIPHFEENGFIVTPEIWDNPASNWEQYDIVLIRSTWDYYLKPEKFKTWVSQFIDSKTKLLNAPEIILKNSHKFYLKELKNKALTSSQLSFLENINLDDLKKWEKVVIKPAVSAGSHETEVFETATLTSEVLDSKISEGDWLIQPFLDEIQKAGEISIIFFNGNFSHAIQKVPKEGDFRVQKQFGAQYLKFEPSKDLLLIAKNIVEISGKYSTYARVDGVMTKNGFLLMEIEMIEPDLFFDLYPNAAYKFCQEIVALPIQNLKE